MCSDRKVETPLRGKCAGGVARWWSSLAFAIAGLAALVWFCLRVIPKPSRAQYPCQRAALPLASAFVVWLTGLIGTVAITRRARRYVAQSRYVVAALMMAAALGVMWMAVSVGQPASAVAAGAPQPANEPIGVARGIHPGRVVWTHDPDATDWAGPGQGQLWVEHVDQRAVSRMFSLSLRRLTGAETDAQAWDALFRDFNRTHGRGDVGFQPGQKVAIKINNVLSHDPTPGSYEKVGRYADNVDCSPQLMIALLKQLTDVAGVAARDITIGDPNCAFSTHLFKPVYGAPGLGEVTYLARFARPNTGRTLAQPSKVGFHWSDPDASRTSRVGWQDSVPKAFAEADYFVDFAVMKSHSMNGVTLCGKNLYGALIRDPDEGTNRPGGFYDMHATTVLQTPGMGHYRCLVDLMGHPQLGGKTLLYLIDGLFAGQDWFGSPRRWRLEPFNGDWPNSIFISQDGVAIDSVGVDFLKTEWGRSFPGWDGADDYLHEAALANNPPSGAVYDPDGDGVALQSLGVHEHWNNPQDKQYSRNLGTGNGIELVRVEPATP